MPRALTANNDAAVKEGSKAWFGICGLKGRGDSMNDIEEEERKGGSMRQQYVNDSEEEKEGEEEEKRG